jgi:hypothetical protein
MVAGCVGAINAVEGGLDDGLGALVREYSMVHSPYPPLYIEGLSLSFETTLKGENDYYNRARAPLQRAMSY